MMANNNNETSTSSTSSPCNSSSSEKEKIQEYDDDDAWLSEDEITKYKAKADKNMASEPSILQQLKDEEEKAKLDSNNNNTSLPSNTQQEKQKEEQEKEIALPSISEKKKQIEEEDEKVENSKGFANNEQEEHFSKKKLDKGKHRAGPELLAQWAKEEAEQEQDILSKNQYFSYIKSQEEKEADPDLDISYIKSEQEKADYELAKKLQLEEDGDDYELASLLQLEEQKEEKDFDFEQKNYNSQESVSSSSNYDVYDTNTVNSDDDEETVLEKRRLQKLDEELKQQKKDRDLAISLQEKLNNLDSSTPSDIQASSSRATAAS